MSTPALDPTSVRAAAQAALANRLDYIDRIVDAQNTRAAAAEKLAAAAETEKNAAAAETAAIKAALDSGWTAAELRTAGLKVPTNLLRKTTTAPAAGKTSATRKPRIPRPSTDPGAPASTSPGAPGTDELAGNDPSADGGHDAGENSDTREFAQAR